MPCQGSRELGYAQDDIENRVIDLGQGGNFVPSFLNVVRG